MSARRPDRRRRGVKTRMTTRAPRAAKTRRRRAGRTAKATRTTRLPVKVLTERATRWTLGYAPSAMTRTVPAQRGRRSSASDVAYCAAALRGVSHFSARTPSPGSRAQAVCATADRLQEICIGMSKVTPVDGGRIPAPCVTQDARAVGTCACVAVGSEIAAGSPIGIARAVCSRSVVGRVQRTRVRASGVHPEIGRTRAGIHPRLIAVAATSDAHERSQHENVELSERRCWIA